MNFGLIVSKQHPPGVSMVDRFREHVDQVRAARDAGFDLIVMGQHYLSTPFQEMQTLPALARLAAEAGTMRIGATVLLLPLLNPVDVAEQVATLDVICEGRFVFGAGLGYRDQEYEAFGVQGKERVGRFVESLEVIRRLWTEDEVTHHGRHWTLDKVTIRPRPLQTPCPLVLVGSQVPAGIERAARIADGWLVVPVPTVDEFARQVRTFATARAAAGRPAAAEIGRLLEVSCAADEDAAIRRAAPYLLEKYAAYLSWGIPGITLDPKAPPEEQLRRLARNRFAVGSPAEVTEALLAQAKAGATHATMRVSWPGMPQKDVLAGIELLGTTVLPEVRRRLAAG